MAQSACGSIATSACGSIAAPRWCHRRPPVRGLQPTHSQPRRLAPACMAWRPRLPARPPACPPARYARCLPASGRCPPLALSSNFILFVRHSKAVHDGTCFLHETICHKTDYRTRLFNAKYSLNLSFPYPNGTATLTDFVDSGVPPQLASHSCYGSHSCLLSWPSMVGQSAVADGCLPIGQRRRTSTVSGVMWRPTPRPTDRRTSSREKTRPAPTHFCSCPLAVSPSCKAPA